MKIEDADLEVMVDRFTDEGDYPSNAGSGPLPSYSYVGGIEGTVVIRLELADAGRFQALELDWDVDADVAQFLLDDGEAHDALIDNVPLGIVVKSWKVERRLADGSVVISVAKFDAEWYDAEPEWGDWGCDGFTYGEDIAI